MATQLPVEEDFVAQTAAAEAIDPFADKNKRPAWWPEDYEGHWDESQGRWVEPEADKPAE